MTRRSANPEVHVALLRGVNLGAKNKLPMRELAAMFAEHGASDVRTYIQSGNVVFRAAPELAARIPERIERAIEERFGFRAPVVQRTSGELLAVMRENPFAEHDPKTLHVGFLLTHPTEPQLAALDPARSPPDAFAVRGREIYLHLRSGVARSKLTNAYFDAKLATVSTFRNWRTVQAIAELAGR